ncbi:ephrin-B2a [Salmo salar]|uniref:Ephrin-B2a n=3 Tax=Salmoninae TaxID=504568 RepID=A0A4W5LZ38_9TELE|nr:ephrin-B2a [Salmo salar]XP_029559006.1 ephrin-B2 [Salmo trutta]|eukprot:XP_014019455.1 PREDICTED: ephrin-B2 [Salmo salar]
MGDSMWRYYFGVLFIACKVNLSRAIILESIYWNTTNTKFVPGQGLVLYPQIGDKLDIVCPRVDGGVRDGVEYYKIHMVPREQLESCTITKADTPLLNCDKPDQDVKFTLKFQEFSPNLWGLEFFRGKDYYIISTSNGTMEGLENQEGGVCKMKSMKIIMKVGQNPSDPISPKDYPTRYPPKHPDKESYKPNEVLEKKGPSYREGEGDQGTGGKSSSVIGSEVALFAGIASGSVIFIIIIIMLVVLLLKYRRRHRKHSPQHATTLSLSTLATPKRGGSGNNNGSEPSDIIIPLRTADSVFCPHYEKVSGDYGHPVYIVQEMPPQSPANIYYKV